MIWQLSLTFLRKLEPQGTVAGVSGFQVNIGSSEISTPGDEPDVLVAMNPAALKANVGQLKKGGTNHCEHGCLH